MGTIHTHNACHETGDINNPVNAIAVTPILSSPFLAENQITAMAIHTMTALATSQGMMAAVSECRIRASIPRNDSLSSAAATQRGDARCLVDILRPIFYRIFWEYDESQHNCTKGRCT